MRICATRIKEAVKILEAEYAALKEISEAENEDEMQGVNGLYADESEAFQELEQIIANLKSILLNT